MRRAVAMVSLVGFLLSLVVHIASLRGIDVQTQIPFVWLLHVGVFVVFVPFAFVVNKRFGRKPKFADLREVLPAAAIAIGGVILAYAVINFLLFWLSAQGGSPDIRDGRFVLQSHGKFIRELSSAEYIAMRANVLRGFSGHWLVFYFVPFAYFMFARPEVVNSQRS